MNGMLVSYFTLLALLETEESRLHCSASVKYTTRPTWDALLFLWSLDAFGRLGLWDSATIDVMMQ